MNKISSNTVKADIAGLSVFASIREHPLIQAFLVLLDADSEYALIRAWGGFMAAFLAASVDASSTWYSAITALVFRTDNEFTRIAEKVEKAEKKDREPSPLLNVLVKTDLERLSRVAAFDISGFGFNAADMVRKAGFETAASHIEECARVVWETEMATKKSAEKIVWNGERLSTYIRVKGAGLLGQYTAFRWNRGGTSGRDVSHLQPVLNPDPVTLSELFGYEDQRNAVIVNTLRFLEGKAANNLLLYGDRGTGKSATVKAVCNEYAEQGLRLVEVRKENLMQIQTVMEELSMRGLRFIVFIDDLSFETTDDSFTGLKALLEGGVEKKPENVVVYATSNRRHFVKEHFDQTDDPRAFDTIQERISLSDRFGLTVVFTAPDQDEFLFIAEQIAIRRGLFDTGEQTAALRTRFRDNAVRWERWFNGRSPRTAAQFVDWVSGGEGFPWE
ncbi:MAG: ATP-binding protein [Treponema sp.]|jgi:predicted AAA+ superfamily ATPase|nr:ATP-binding protein [Treponema sp.]